MLHITVFLIIRRKKLYKLNLCREEGWIHHLARHAVACFLTRGDLWISWEEGMKVRHH
jgi:hypothetical protein